MSAEFLSATLDQAENRVFVLVGRHTDSGHGCKVFCVGSKACAEKWRDTLRAAASPYQFAIAPIVTGGAGAPAELEFTP